MKAKRMADAALEATLPPSTRDVKHFAESLEAESAMEACRVRIWKSALIVSFNLFINSQVCGIEQGPALLHYRESEKLDDQYLSHLFCILRARFDDKKCRALAFAHGTVERNAYLGALKGLDKYGCMNGATAICTDCFQCLRKKSQKMPQNALINDTWQGTIPDVLQFKSEECPNGLNLVEMSMICLYCPITYITMLKGGARASALLLNRSSKYQTHLRRNISRIHAIHRCVHEQL
jgi:hypothetical protein